MSSKINWRVAIASVLAMFFLVGYVVDSIADVKRENRLAAENVALKAQNEKKDATIARLLEGQTELLVLVRAQNDRINEFSHTNKEFVDWLRLQGIAVPDKFVFGENRRPESQSERRDREEREEQTRDRDGGGDNPKGQSPGKNGGNGGNNGGSGGGNNNGGGGSDKPGKSDDKSHGQNKGGKSGDHKKDKPNKGKNNG